MRLPDCRSIPTQRARRAALAASSRRVIRWPAISTYPPSGSSRPARQASSVDFPLPDGPATATSSPARTETDTPRSANVSSCPVWKKR